MTNTATKIAMVLVVLALPAASLARTGGSVASSSASMSQMRARGAAIGSAQLLDQSERKNPPAVAPIPPPRISVPEIPHFK